MSTSMERRLTRLEGGSPDEVFTLKDHEDNIAFQGTQAELNELMEEVYRRTQIRRQAQSSRWSKVDPK